MPGRIIHFVCSCATQKIFWRMLVLASASAILLYIHSCRACACVMLYVVLSLTIMTEITEEIGETESLIADQGRTQVPDGE